MSKTKSKKNTKFKKLTIKLAHYLAIIATLGSLGYLTYQLYETIIFVKTV